MPPPLDKNLFTLSIENSKEEAGATDLYDTDGVAVYRRRWGDSKEGSYAVNIFGKYTGVSGEESYMYVIWKTLYQILY
jgi:hypothetical protein